MLFGCGFAALREYRRCAQILFAFVISTFLGGALWAQKTEIGAGLLVGLPQGEFSDRLDATGWGFSFRFARSIRHSAVSVGAELGYLLYGSEKWRTTLLEDVPDVVVNVHTTNNILLGTMFVRLQRQRGRARPYVEGDFGGEYLFTNTSLENAGTGEAFASTINLHDSAFVYGGGGGVQLVLWDGARRGVSPVAARIMLDARLRYMRGPEAHYLKKGSIHREDGDVTYDVLTSRTDMLLPEISLVARF